MLLVASLVAARLLAVAMPGSQSQTFVQAIGQQEAPLAITVRQDGSIFLQETKIEQESVFGKLQAFAQKYPDSPVYIRGDKGVNYGQVMEIMGMAYSAGFGKVLLVADPQATGGKQ